MTKRNGQWKTAQLLALLMPVEPKPAEPRLVSLSCSTSLSTGWPIFSQMTCAMRSPIFTCNRTSCYSMGMPLNHLELLLTEVEEKHLQLATVIRIDHAGAYKQKLCCDKSNL